MKNSKVANASSARESDVSRRDMIKLSAVAAASLGGGLTLQVGRAYPAGATNKIRMGVVGGGFGTQFSWNEHPNCEVTGVTDLRPDRRKKLRETYQCDAVYDSLEEMIPKARNRIDAVAVFSGAIDHVKHATMCMENGWHVISAVPACFTLEEASQLKETVERTGLSYMMAETSYYRSPCIFARELFRKGALGNLFYSEAEYYHDRGDLKRLANDKKTRFFMPDGSYAWRWGFPPMHYPTHAVGFLTGVTKERVTKVSCLGWGSSHPFLDDNAYDNPFWNCTSLMRTNGGHMSRCNVFWLCAAHGERAQWFGDKASFYMEKRGVHDAKLMFRTKGDTPTEYDLPVQAGGVVNVPVYWKTEMLPAPMRHVSGHGGSHTFIAAEFINSLLEQRSPAINLYEALAMTVPGVVAHQSALKDGEQLDVPQFDKSNG